jgi:hypothetical protein
VSGAAPLVPYTVSCLWQGQIHSFYIHHHTHIPVGRLNAVILRDPFAPWPVLILSYYLRLAIPNGFYCWGCRLSGAHASSHALLTSSAATDYNSPVHMLIFIMPFLFCSVTVLDSCCHGNERVASAVRWRSVEWRHSDVPHVTSEEVGWSRGGAVSWRTAYHTAIRYRYGYKLTVA